MALPVASRLATVHPSQRLLVAVAEADARPPFGSKPTQNALKSAKEETPLAPLSMPPHAKRQSAKGCAVMVPQLLGSKQPPMRHLVAGAAQAWPQVPQLAVSLLRSTQWPLHTVCPATGH